MSDSIEKSLLGKTTEYPDQYQPDILFPVSRSTNRAEFGIDADQPFTGVDVWHGYEVSWLNNKGKPVVALARYIFPASSPNIVESKSFKLYLNSFNQTKFESKEQVQKVMCEDLSKASGAQVKLELFTPEEEAIFNVTKLPGECIDDLDIEIDSFELNPQILKTIATKNPPVKETLYSHLLKSNCAITSQPDWASVIIDYEGDQLCRESLLRYLISFRQHDEFHEHCVERIFMDIQTQCQPAKLSVQALYTRRGGLDINPFRSSVEADVPFYRMNRQ